MLDALVLYIEVAFGVLLCGRFMRQFALRNEETKGKDILSVRKTSEILS
jgi:hypothetical protein